MLEDNVASDVGDIHTGADISEGADKSTASSGQERGLLTRIAENPAVRNMVFALSTIIGGAGVTSLTGCAPDNSYNNQVGVVRMLEKEAKFSTIGIDAKVPLQDMPKLLEQREPLAKAIDGAIPHARELVTNFEADGKLPQGTLESLKTSLQGVEKALMTAATQESFAPIKSKLVEFSEKVKEIQQIAPADFQKGTESAGYSKTQAVMQSLYDWGTAVERDIVNLKSGTHALKIATLVDAVQKTETSLKTVDKEESISKWVSSHSAEATKIGESVATAIASVGKSASDPAFTAVHEDLGDLKKLLMDLSKVFPTPTAEAYPSSPDAKSEKALVKETLALVAALRADLQKELTHTLGVQAPSAVAQTPGSSQPATSGAPGTQVTHHHHDSGSNLMLWYMLLNNNRGYGSGFTYVPNHAPTYSNASRLRTSPEYSSFAKTSQDNHSTLGGRGGFGSHVSGPLGRSAPSVSGGSGFKAGSGISSPSRSTGASHIGGFGAGRSSSAGFGG